MNVMFCLLFVTNFLIFQPKLLKEGQKPTQKILVKTFARFYLITLHYLKLCKSFVKCNLSGFVF